MKMRLLIFAITLAAYSSYAQSTFPTDGGSVGINTLSPESGYKLDVNGLGAIGAKTSARIYLGTMDATNAYIQSRDLNVNRNLQFYASGYHFITGNVGIGTTTPTDKLDINGHITLSGGSKEIRFRDAGNTIKQFVWLTSGNSLGLGAGSESNSMFINTTGSVGIGTFSIPSDYKLAVNGAVIATSMKVKLYDNWPDFVFLKDYELPALTEVKTFIDKNRHLPDMPSANEVHTNGLDLGEMNRLLLKKVEELTLYLIEKDKADKEKDARLQSLQTQINALKKTNRNYTGKITRQN